MARNEAYVLLCRCRDAVEAQAVRAALDARGIPVRVEGEHMHGILGSLHGAMVQPRIMVPPAALGVSRQLAAEIVGPFDDPDEPLDPHGEGSPWRLPAELDDGPDAVVSPDDDAPDEGPLVRRKSLGVIGLLALMGLAVGFAHIYVGRPRRGLALLVVAAFAVGSLIAGRSGGVLLPLVWLLDVVGGVLGVLRHNRGIAAPAAPALSEQRR
jgi:Putative prokaryotic signal transducing protein